MYFFILASSAWYRPGVIGPRSPVATAVSNSEFEFLRINERRPTIDTKLDRKPPRPRRPAFAAHNCRTHRRPGPPGYSMTTLNRRARLIQGQGAQSQLFLGRSMGF